MGIKPAMLGILWDKWGDQHCFNGNAHALQSQLYQKMGCRNYASPMGGVLFVNNHMVS
jgi:hypothetical protein